MIPPMRLMFLDFLFSTDAIVEVQSAIGTEWESPMRGLTLLGDSRLIYMFAVVLLWYVASRRPYQVLMASLLGSAIGSVTKLLIDHPRPSDPDLLIASGSISPSLPSGHAVLATVFWGTLAWYGWIPRWVAGFIVALVMLTRVYLGAHFPGDVLIGLAIGLLWLVIFHWIVGPRVERASERTLTAGVAVITVGTLLVLPVVGEFTSGWEIVSGLIGVGTGLTWLRYRERYVPGEPCYLKQFGKGIIGLTGLAVIVAIDHLLQQEVAVAEFGLYLLAGLWGAFLSPRIFTLIGLETGIEHTHQAG